MRHHQEKAWNPALALTDLPRSEVRGRLTARNVVIDPPGVRMEALRLRGVMAPTRGGESVRVALTLGVPRRIGGGRASGSGGWWAVPVRSEFGGESLLRYDPQTTRCDGVVWLMGRQG